MGIQVLWLGVSRCLGVSPGSCPLPEHPSTEGSVRRPELPRSHSHHTQPVY